ncbi:Rhodanese/Cell cycle control phosphatase superfamily protein [Capsicum annuum]|uniref:TBCC domain-containing protein 1 n=1 Tax=Capsicum annuum TaxID=4072 RepID=UPI0007BF8704|nr:TBCC domain-containing protein 1 [Capsicum annuum]KAF3655426.1 Rhodanese/Cell cycle control phosphatase superfamily protein [Capsicum annuum]
MPDSEEQPPQSTPSTAAPTNTTTSPPPIYIHPRREPFEHGLLPIPKLIFTDGAQSLLPIRDKLLSLSSSTSGLKLNRVNCSSITESLQISNDHARLVIETIASVLHVDSDPCVKAKANEIGDVGVNVYDLMLFLYIQSYKRLLPKGHKDSAAVADVWPSTSAFDGFLSALTPLQLVRSNSRRSMPSQADEEAHQLSYLQKHLGNILSLLAESVEGDGEESLVLSMEKLEHLGFLIFFGEKGSEKIPLSQNAPFFANSDPEMPAVPVPAAHVHDWLLENIAAALTRITERASAKENGPTSAPDQDVPMADVSASSVKSSPSPRGPSSIEGISKSSYVRLPNDIKGSSVKVINCHESVIYVLAPLKYATVYGCSDATIVLGAVGKAVRIEHCERVHVIAAAKRICIANCRECIFFLGVNQTPLLVGDNHKLQVAPYNTFYSLLEAHLNQVGIDPTVNRWDAPVALGVVDPHDSLSHPAGVSDVQTESASPVDPDQFTNFLIPNWFEGQQSGPTKDNPFPLPDAYLASQQRNHKSLEETKNILKDTELDESRKREVATALHVCFKDWLYASGNIRQLYCLQGE